MVISGGRSRGASVGGRGEHDSTECEINIPSLCFQILTIEHDLCSSAHLEGIEHCVRYSVQSEWELARSRGRIIVARSSRWRCNASHPKQGSCQNFSRLVFYCDRYSRPNIVVTAFSDARLTNLQTQRGTAFHGDRPFYLVGQGECGARSLTLTCSLTPAPDRHQGNDIERR